MKHWIYFLLIISFNLGSLSAQHSVARNWNEVLLNGIRGDFARPTVHSRNLFHCSIAMYDAWSAYDSIAKPFFLGNTLGEYTAEFEGLSKPDNLVESRDEAISFAMYRLLRHRFLSSPGAWDLYLATDSLMAVLGYDIGYISKDYTNGNPAALGNYIADEIIKFGIQDGANEALAYENVYYQSVNPPLVMDQAGNSTIIDPNRWQSLTLEVFIDQSGNVIPLNTPEFLGPEWGNVVPFALSDDDAEVHEKDDGDYKVYQDPGEPWYIQNGEGIDDPYKWGAALVSVWSSHLGRKNDTIIDISPGSIGNNDILPQTFDEYKDFYNLIQGGDNSQGHSMNPKSGLSYAPNLVKRSDYGRVLAEFWADGPDSETPPGHWFSILNYVNDSPELEKRFAGKGPVLDDLEWDVKSYLTLGGAMHDCAVTAWGIKGYYDYIRPVSAIRYMATKGQSTDENLPNYDLHGMPLLDGYIELIQEGDPLLGSQSQNLNEVKILAWKGPDYIISPDTSVADVDWILAKEWWPYQRPSFVTPPFAGYVSGHSTFSRAAADILEALTGDPFFPGGIAEFKAVKEDFLVFEDGPSEDIVLQWATYRDASDQTSLSRIWGGIHPPIDDIPGRKIGVEIADNCFKKAREIYYEDRDNDGYFSYEDCDDLNANFFPGAVEICDGLDNNCDGQIDEELELFTYFKDSDGDGFGNILNYLDTCSSEPPFGYVLLSDDCDDSLAYSNPQSNEICDGLDNNCDGRIDENLELYRYFLDSDGDGFGDANVYIDTCLLTSPQNYISDNNDCDDSQGSIFPEAIDIPDNGIDEDCSGRDASNRSFLLSNLGAGLYVFHYPESLIATLKIYSTDGKLYESRRIDFSGNYVDLNFINYTSGLFILTLVSDDGEILHREKILIQK